MQIWKHTLRMEYTQFVGVPVGSTMLSVQVQKGVPQLWFIANKKERVLMDVCIDLYATGHQMLEKPGRFLGTIQLNDGDLVFHAFVRETGDAK